MIAPVDALASIKTEALAYTTDPMLAFIFVCSDERCSAEQTPPVVALISKTADAPSILIDPPEATIILVLSVVTFPSKDDPS